MMRDAAYRQFLLTSRLMLENIGKFGNNWRGKRPAKKIACAGPALKNKTFDEQISLSCHYALLTLENIDNLGSCIRLWIIWVT